MWRLCSLIAGDYDFSRKYEGHMSPITNESLVKVRDISLDFFGRHGNYCYSCCWKYFSYDVWIGVFTCNFWWWGGAGRCERWLYCCRLLSQLGSRCARPKVRMCRCVLDFFLLLCANAIAGVYLPRYATVSWRGIRLLCVYSQSVVSLAWYDNYHAVWCMPVCIRYRRLALRRISISVCPGSVRLWPLAGYGGRGVEYLFSALVCARINYARRLLLYCFSLRVVGEVSSGAAELFVLRRLGCAMYLLYCMYAPNEVVVCICSLVRAPYVGMIIF